MDDLDVRVARYRAEEKAKADAQAKIWQEEIQNTGHPSWQETPHKECLWFESCTCKCPQCCATALLKGTPGVLADFKRDLLDLLRVKTEFGNKENLPFFCESYLYELVGKEDARTILGRFERLVRAVGITDKERWD